MSRVAHWAQNQSLDHFATEIESQNYGAPGAEIIQLNLFVFTGSDQTANMVAWVAYVGAIAAAASLADVLGAQPYGVGVSQRSLARLYRSPLLRLPARPGI